MKKVAFNAWVDILAFVFGSFSALSGFVLWFALPRGGGRGQLFESNFLGWSRHQWVSLHNYSSLILVLLVLLHLYLHWAWIKNLGQYIKKRK